MRRDLLAKYVLVLVFVAVVLAVSLGGAGTTGFQEIVFGLVVVAGLGAFLYYLMFVRGRRGR